MMFKPKQFGIGPEPVPLPITAEGADEGTTGQFAAKIAAERAAAAQTQRSV